MHKEFKSPLCPNADVAHVEQESAQELSDLNSNFSYFALSSLSNRNSHMTIYPQQNPSHNAKNKFGHADPASTKGKKDSRLNGAEANGCKSVSKQSLNESTDAQSSFGKMSVGKTMDEIDAMFTQSHPQ